MFVRQGQVPGGLKNESVTLYYNIPSEPVGPFGEVVSSKLIVIE